MSLDYVSLGRTGTAVSNVAFGTWRFGRETDAGDVDLSDDQFRRLAEAAGD